MSPKVIGHRGAAGLAQGNSIAGLKKATELGADMVELDVRVSKDGVPILSHDPDVKHFIVAETSLRQLKTVMSDIVLFADAIAAAGKTPLFIEVKPHVKTEPIIALLKSLPLKTLKTYKVASFDPKVLADFKREMPHLERVVLEKWSSLRARRHAHQADTKTLAMNKKWLWGVYIRAISKAGYTLYAYTLNNPKKANRWIHAGLKGVITDYPDRFIKR